MKRKIGTLLLLCASAVTHADNAAVVTGSLGGTTDFVFRGISLTRGKPAAQGSIDVEFPKEIYAGAFSATCDPNPGPSAPVELDFWVGKYWRISEDYSADLRLSEYTYPRDPRHRNYNRTEITGTVGFHNQLFFATSYSPNTQAVGTLPGYAEGTAFAFELSGRQPLGEHFALSAGFGHYDLEDVYHDSYNYWNVTLSATFAPFELQLAYLGVDDTAAEHFLRDSVGDRVAFTALWRFSSTH